MRGIVLKDVIEQFGFRTGFNLWFRWSLIDPIQMWIWLNITHKPYCTYSGYHCREKDCEHKHLFTKKDILKRWEKHEEQSKVIIQGENGECAYCSEEKGTEIIDDPNWDTLERWKVCETCKEVIGLQRESSFPIISQERHQEINDRLLEISKQTGKPITSAQISKGKDGYESSSVTFTGEEK